MTYIKICRVGDYPTARALVWQGADFLGFHFLNDAELSPDNPLATVNKTLVNIDSFNGGVLLSRTVDPNRLGPTADAGQFHYIQVHCDFNLSELTRLKMSEAARNRSIIAVVDPTKRDSSEIREINEISDYILVDHLKGGTGQQVPEALIDTLPMERCFLAGGLNSGNVRQKVAKFNPFAVDVQTATESDKTKDLRKSGRFVRELRQNHLRYPEQTSGTNLSISLSKHHLVSAGVAHSVIMTADSLHLDIVDATNFPHIPGISNHELDLLGPVVRSRICDLHVFGFGSAALTRVDCLLEYVEPRTAYLHAESLREAQTQIDLLREMRTRGLRPGLAIPAHVILQGSNNAALFDILGTKEVMDVLVIGPSTRHADFRHRSSVINEAVGILQLSGQPIEISIDRGITPDLLPLLELAGVSSVSAGESVWSSEDPLATLRKMRISLV